MNMRADSVDDISELRDMLDLFFPPGTVLIAPDNGEKYTIMANTPDKIRLTVTNWQYNGGVHFSGRLRYFPIKLCNEEGNSVSGYLDGLPAIEDGIEIDLQRPVTQRDLDSAEDWDTYIVGQGTTRFDDLETMKQTLIEFLDRFFPGVKVDYECVVYDTVELSFVEIRRSFDDSENEEEDDD